MKLQHENMANIRRRFTAKTGVSMPESRPRRLPARSLLLAAVLAVLLTATAFAGTLFSGLEGDDLALSAEYLGGGVVEITVENRSGKSLNLQPAVGSADHHGLLFIQNQIAVLPPVVPQKPSKWH